MKNIQVTINPTEIRHIDFTNAFNKRPGEKISLQVKSEATIKLNPSNPVVALVIVNLKVEDPDKSISMNIETITGVTVSTFIDDLEGFIRSAYMPVIIMASNEKVRNVTTNIGFPIKLPNPVFGTSDAKPEGLTQ